MIKRNTEEWAEFVSKLDVIKTKSNREVLCIHCWQMLNCKQKIKHLKTDPEHEKFLLTSTKYASEKQILGLAEACNKIIKKGDNEFIITPYGPLSKSLKEIQENSHDEDDRAFGEKCSGNKHSIQHEKFKFVES